MKINYDNQHEKWEECIKDKNRNKFSQNWLRRDTLDYWRHQRMLRPLDAFILKGETWLTIGDGRYGTEANHLIRKGANAHASDLSEQLLKVSKNKGFINEYSKQNAENLQFSDDSFDYVLIKEALHHCPRPWIALHEAFRVCKKGVILIEPNDQLSGKFNVIKFLIFIVKKFLKKKINFKDYNFEEVGNFIFTINLREIEKFMLSMHYRKLAFIKMNDYYIKGVEEINLNPINFKGKKKKYFLKLILKLKDFFSNLRLAECSIILVALFKEDPSKDTIEKLKINNWNLIKLPKNPFRK